MQSEHQRGGRRKVRDVDEEGEVARRATAKLEEGDVRGALRVLSSRDTLAPKNDETVAKPARTASVNAR